MKFQCVYRSDIALCANSFSDFNNRTHYYYFLILQPMEVYVDDEAKLTLHGLQQHYVKLKENEKNKKLFELLDVLEFNQVRFVHRFSKCNCIAYLYILNI